MYTKLIDNEKIMFTKSKIRYRL